MASFPSSIVTPTDPISTNTLNSPDHAGEHQSHNAEIVALETKLGTGSSTASSGKVLRATGTGTSGWGQVVLSTDVASATSADLRGVLSDETGTGSAVFGTAPTISAPVVSTGAFASPVLTTPAVITSINDANGNEVIKTPATASAVNEITVTNAATGNAPSISATGSDSTAHLNLRGKGLAKTVTIGVGAATIFPYDFVLSGCVWTADAVGSTRLASMTSGVVVINGNPITVAAVTSRTFTASKDVYVDVLDNGDGTGLLVYTDGTTNAASGALAANSIRLAIIVVGATNIATTASINQGQEDRVLPIASSIPYAVTDSLGNLICPRDMQRKTYGYRQLANTFAGSGTSAQQITGLSVPVISPTGGKRFKIMAYARDVFTSGGTTSECTIAIWDGAVGGTQIADYLTPNTTAGDHGAICIGFITSTAGTHTYNVSVATTSGNPSVSAISTSPAFVIVESA